MFRLVISLDGHTEYQFDDEVTPAIVSHRRDAPTSSSATACQIIQTEKSGYGLVTLSKFSLGKVLLVADTPFCVPAGAKSMHICYHCLRVASKMKRREDCPYLFFCSSDCLSATSDYMDWVSSTLATAAQHCLISDPAESMTARKHANQEATEPDRGNLSQLFHTTLLVTQILYKSTDDDDDDDDEEEEEVSVGQHMSNSLLEVLQLNLHLNEALSEDTLSLINMLVMTLEKVLQEQISSRMFQFLSRYCMVTKGQLRLLLEKLFRAVQYNSYTLPVPNLSHTHVLCLSPLLARLNHSCRPNCILQARLPVGDSGNASTNSNTTVKKGAVARAQVRRRPRLRLLLQCVQDVEPGAELTVSYLTMPCLPLTARADLLLAGFHFNCACTRCDDERFSGLQQQEPSSGGQNTVGTAISRSDENWLAGLNRKIGTNAQSSAITTTDLVRIRAILESLGTQSDLTRNSGTNMNLSYTSVYACHDIALSMLNTAMKAPQGDTNTALTRVLACSIASHCCLLVGQTYSTQRLELLLTAFSQLPIIQRALHTYPQQWKISKCMSEICDAVLAIVRLLDIDQRFPAFEKLSLTVAKAKATLSS